MHLDKKEKDRLNEFYSVAIRANINALSSMSQLWSITDNTTRSTIEKILTIDLKEYGIRLPYSNLEEATGNMVKVKKPGGNESGEDKLDRYDYLPKQVFEAFDRMAEDFQTSNPTRKLLVGSGYRSPALQVLTLVYILSKLYDFDISRTLKRVTLPNFSQHCLVTNTAIDMLNIDGQPSDEKPQAFKDSIEYKWLRINAERFGFFESYPINNPYGVMWEPWHWQFRGINH